MKSFAVNKYEAAGCKEMTGAMLVVYMATNGKVCDTGCYAYSDGKCSAFLRLTQKISPLTTNPQQETVKQEATRRKISISEVRRQRRNK